MTPEEELARLNRVIHQYETVFKTTTDSGQRQRVEKQLRELMKQREQILAVNVIDTKTVQDAEEPDSLAEFHVPATPSCQGVRAEARPSAGVALGA